MDETVPARAGPTDGCRRSVTEPSGADGDDSLRAYGEAFDVAARAPTLLGVVLAAIGVALVWAWRRIVTRRSSGR